MKNLNLATFNCCNFGDWTSELRYSHIKNLILTELQDMDCIAVQEVGASLEEGKTIARTMYKLCEELNFQQHYKKYSYLDIPPQPNSTGGQENFNIRCGFIICQTLEVIKIESIAANMSAFSGCSELKYAASRYPLALFLRYEGHLLCIINCHLKSMRAQPKNLSHTFKKQRHAQAQLINHFVNELQTLNPETSIIVVGDCNDVPSSKTVDLLKGEVLQSIYPPKLKNIFTTMHANAPIILDYMFYNKQLNLESWEVKSLERDLAISDHNPVCATFTFI